MPLRVPRAVADRKSGRQLWLINRGSEGREADYTSSSAWRRIHRQGELDGFLSIGFVPNKARLAKSGQLQDFRSLTMVARGRRAAFRACQFGAR